jgi:hypothetical protein
MAARAAPSRMAGLKPTILFESRNPHTLLALAEAGHGVAIVPSQLQCHRYQLRIVGLTYRGRALREPLTISWDKRRSLPRFCDGLLRNARRVHAGDLPDISANRTQASNSPGQGTAQNGQTRRRSLVATWAVVRERRYGSLSVFGRWHDIRKPPNPALRESAGAA